MGDNDFKLYWLNDASTCSSRGNANFYFMSWSWETYTFHQLGSLKCKSHDVKSKTRTSQEELKRFFQRRE